MQDGAAEVLLTMGSIMLAADITQDAAIYLRLVLYLKPDIEIATVLLAQAYGDLRQYDMANELLQKIPAKSQLYTSAQLYMAVNLGKMQKIDEALLKLDALTAVSPDNIEIYMAKGDLLRIKERFLDAVKVYELALSKVKELKPQHWPIFFAMGTCFDRQGDWQQAEKNLNKSLELSPNQPDVLNYLGYSLLIRGGDVAKARKLIEKALRRRPTDPQIIDSMGWALYLSGDYENAVKNLEIAISLLPADPTINEHLGDVYWRLDRKNEARFQWDRALVYLKDDVQAQEINKKLENGLPSLVTNKNNESRNAKKKDKNSSVNAAMVE